MNNDFADVGADKTFKTPNEAIDRVVGTYHDKACDGSEEAKLATAQMPMGPGKQPFANIQKSNGGR